MFSVLSEIVCTEQGQKRMTKELDNHPNGTFTTIQTRASAPLSPAIVALLPVSALILFPAES